MARIEQPTDEYRVHLDAIMSAEPELVEFRGKERKVGWLHKGTIRYFTHVMVKEKDPYKRSSKLCALVLLNNVWKIRFFYWLLWRYYFYVVDLDEVEVLKVLDVAKKKVQREPFYLNTMLSTAMMDLMMTMTREEVERIQAEQAGAQRSR